MIDWTRVDELRDEVGAEDFAEVVTLFLEEVEAALEVIQTQTGAKELESSLHFLKGSALNVGFSDLSQLCHTGEVAAAEKRPRDVDLGAVMRCYRVSRRAFLQDPRAGCS